MPLNFDPANALTNLLYSGEIFDQRTAMQYLRARYYDPASGTFNRLDPFAGNIQDPQSLHKYLYVHGDPISGIDPSGLFFDRESSSLGQQAHVLFALFCTEQRPGGVQLADKPLKVVLPHIFGENGPGAQYGRLQPDCVDTVRKEYFELKPMRHKGNESAQQYYHSMQMSKYDHAFLVTNSGYRRGDSHLLVPYQRGGIEIGVVFGIDKEYVVTLYPSPTTLTPSLLDGRGYVHYALRPLTDAEKSRKPRRIPPFIDRVMMDNDSDIGNDVGRKVEYWGEQTRRFLEADETIAAFTALGAVATGYVGAQLMSRISLSFAMKFA